MSMICKSCLEPICAPEPAWYAGTAHSPTVSYVCGTCVSFIPHKERTMVPDLQPFTITFGHLIAPVGRRNQYQSNGSRQDRVIFSVNTSAIEQAFVFTSAFLDSLYPYYCIDEYISEIMAAYKVEQHSEPGAWQHLVDSIQIYGTAIAAWLDVPCSASHDRIETSADGHVSLIEKNRLSTSELKAVLKELMKKNRL